jgi:hypothetical protein
MPLVLMVEVAVNQVVDVAGMYHRGVAAADPVRVIVSLVHLMRSHGSAPFARLGFAHSIQ